MRYLIIGLLAIAIMGCGSSDVTTQQETTIEQPKIPQPSDKEKQPPAIPVI